MEKVDIGFGFGLLHLCNNGKILFLVGGVWIAGGVGAQDCATEEGSARASIEKSVPLHHCTSAIWNRTKYSTSSPVQTRHGMAEKNLKMTRKSIFLENIFKSNKLNSHQSMAVVV